MAPPGVSSIAGSMARLHTRFDRKLLGELGSCAWTCTQAEAQRTLGGKDGLPGMMGAIQAHGELLHWHPPRSCVSHPGVYTASSLAA